MKKIIVKTPIVELDGDEMARVIWGMIKERFIYPYLDLEIKYFDLGIKNRDFTDDNITVQAALAIKKYGIGIKCATITPDENRVKEFGLKKMWPSPNATIRNIIGGTIFREPIVVANVPKLITNWDSPICIGRHAYGDQYMATDFEVRNTGSLKIEFCSKEGIKQVYDILNVNENSVIMIMQNNEKSIRDFAHACFRKSLEKQWPLYLSTKNTVLKSYDGMFKNVFEDIYENHYKDDFVKNGLTYQHKLIDDMVASAIKWNGKFVWACKNYDGDVQSDVVAQGFGSLGLMTSELMSANGEIIETEAAHGTITRHFREFQKGNKTSTNPVASLYAWTRGLAYKGKREGNHKLVEFSNKLEQSCISTIESGKYTKDLAICIKGNSVSSNDYLTTERFMEAIEENFKQLLKSI